MPEFLTRFLSSSSFRLFFLLLLFSMFIYRYYFYYFVFFFFDFVSCNSMLWTLDKSTHTQVLYDWFEQLIEIGSEVAAGWSNRGFRFVTKCLYALWCAAEWCGTFLIWKCNYFLCKRMFSVSDYELLLIIVQWSGCVLYFGNTMEEWSRQAASCAGGGMTTWCGEGVGTIR